MRAHALSRYWMATPEEGAKDECVLMEPLYGNPLGRGERWVRFDVNPFMATPQEGAKDGCVLM